MYINLNWRSRDENQQQAQPTYDAGSGNRTRDTLVGGERSHHCATLAPQLPKLYDKWKLPERTHMTETTMWKPGLTCHWRRLCRRGRTQFHRDDRVAAVVWVVLDNRTSVFIWSSQSDDKYDRDDYTATWVYAKKWKPPETTICKPGLT